MKSLPKIDLQPRVLEDVERLLAFVGQQPWGDPESRRREISAAFQKIRHSPLSRPVRKRVRGTNIEIRCYHCNQFVVAYAYLCPSPLFPSGLVTIRAVGHRRQRDVLFRVREVEAPGSGPALHTHDSNEIFGSHSSQFHAHQT